MNQESVSVRNNCARLSTIRQAEENFSADPTIARRQWKGKSTDSTHCGHALATETIIISTVHPNPTAKHHTLNLNA